MNTHPAPKKTNSDNIASTVRTRPLSDVGNPSSSYVISIDLKKSQSVGNLCGKVSDQFTSQEDVALNPFGSNIFTKLFCCCVDSVDEDSVDEDSVVSRSVSSGAGRVDEIMSSPVGSIGVNHAPLISEKTHKVKNIEIPFVLPTKKEAIPIQQNTFDQLLLDPNLQAHYRQGSQRGFPTANGAIVLVGKVQEDNVSIVVKDASAYHCRNLDLILAAKVYTQMGLDSPSMSILDEGDLKVANIRQPQVDEAVKKLYGFYRRAQMKRDAVLQELLDQGVPPKISVTHCVVYTRPSSETYKKTAFDLGKLLAVDILIGNIDRFCFNTGQLINPENILYRNGFQPVAIDNQISREEDKLVCTPHGYLCKFDKINEFYMGEVKSVQGDKLTGFKEGIQHFLASNFAHFSFYGHADADYLKKIDADQYLSDFQDFLINTQKKLEQAIPDLKNEDISK